MGSGWQVEEFGEHHKGRAVAVLEDGSEPKPALFDTGSAGSVHQTTDWHVYNGTLRQPLATALRGGCSCGWRGDTVHPIAWEQDEDGEPWADSPPGPQDDWVQHMHDTEARAVPVPQDITDLLAQLDTKVQHLTAESPAAALRAVAALKRIAETAGKTAAFNLGSDANAGELSWEEIAVSLGLPERDAHSEVYQYLH